MPMALIRGYPGADRPLHQATGHTHTQNVSTTDTHMHTFYVYPYVFTHKHTKTEDSQLTQDNVCSSKT